MSKTQNQSNLFDTKTVTSKTIKLVRLRSVMVYLYMACSLSSPLHNQKKFFFLKSVMKLTHTQNTYIYTCSKITSSFHRFKIRTGAAKSRKQKQLLNQLEF